MDKLRLLNFVLFALHLFSCVFILANRDKVQEYAAKIGVYSSEITPDSGAQSYGYGFKFLGTVNLVYLIAAFFAITAAFHLIYALGANSFYGRMIAAGSNPLRWIEYSFTATIMVAILALTASVQSLQQLLLLVVATIVIMLLGGVIERAIRDRQLGYARQLTALAWLLELCVFFVIGAAFVSTIHQVNSVIGSQGGIPDWVYVILVSELLFYSAFGFLQLVQLVRAGRGRGQDFRKYEYGYHALSLLAKLTLGWTFYFGATRERK